MTPTSKRFATLNCESSSKRPIGWDWWRKPTGNEITTHQIWFNKLAGQLSALNGIFYRFDFTYEWTLNSVHLLLLSGLLCTLVYDIQSIEFIFELSISYCTWVKNEWFIHFKENNQCCGINGAEDWLASDFDRIPPECCHEVNRYWRMEISSQNKDVNRTYCKKEGNGSHYVLIKTWAKVYRFVTPR